MRRRSRSAIDLGARRLGLLALAICLLFGSSACRKEPRDGRLLVGGSGDQRSPAWMPDEKGLLYSASLDGLPDDIYLFDFNTKIERRLVADPTGENSPAVSPNGRFVVFHSDRSGESDLYRLDLYTSAVARLTTSPKRDGFASWSPDSRRIAFHSEGAGDPDIWVMNRDGTEKLPIVLRPGVDSTPAWAPGGEAIAFAGEGASGNPDIWLVHLEDNRLVRLTESVEAEWSPAWSPDGKRIAYVRGPMDKGHSNLWIMNADGSGQRPLTRRRECDDFAPAWSPDGKRIAFESNCSGDFDIWVIDAPR